MIQRILIQLDDQTGRMLLQRESENSITISRILVAAMTMDVMARSKNSGKAPIHFWEQIDKALNEEKMKDEMYEIFSDSSSNLPQQGGLDYQSFD